MRFASLTLSVLAAAFLALNVAPSRADDAPAINPGLTGEYVKMAQELKLSDDQQAKLADLAKQRKDAVTKWEADNQAQLTALKEKMKSSNNDEATQAKHDNYELTSARRTLEAGYDAQISALLTPDQALTWETIKVNREMLSKFKKVELTDDQKAQVKTMAAQTAAAITKLTTPSAKTLKGLRDQLATDIHDKVLTDAQRQLYDAAAPKHSTMPPSTQPVN